jgi:hypothetical protein
MERGDQIVSNTKELQAGVGSFFFRKVQSCFFVKIA